MNEILKSLEASRTVLDLGCGPGSFDYSSYPFRIIGIDLHLEPATLYRDDRRVLYLRSTSDQIPLEAESVDLIYCHHTLEHFRNYKETLSEIGRILKPEGVVWIAVPDGYGFDDTLFRHIFSGGGHVNQFQRDQLAREVTERTGAKLRHFMPLYSGFVFLKIPTPEQLVHYPKTAEYLAGIPERLSTLWITAVNLVTRIVDSILGSQASLYGWGLIFSREEIDIGTISACFNVCWNCGKGNAASDLKAAGLLLKRFGLTVYRCHACKRQNFFVRPLPGTE